MIIRVRKSKPGGRMDDVEFDAANMVREILRTASTASLGTVGHDGSPLVTLVTVATDIDGSIIGLFSSLAAHTRNLANDGRASLLMTLSSAGRDDPLAGARASFTGRFLHIDRDETEQARLFCRFMARHPEAVAFARFADFSIYRMRPDSVHLVAGFGRVVRLSGPSFLVPADSAAAFASAQPALLSQLNGEGRSAIARAASKTLGRSSPGWSAVAVDPDGIDIADEVVARLTFRRRASDPADVTSRLAELEAGRPFGAPMNIATG